MKNTTLRLLCATSVLLIAAQGASAQSPTPADNTRANKLDTTNRAATADMQKNDQSDLMLSKTIRKSVMADKSLSTYAHNVKIVAVNGTVTLNGVVRSDQEKSALEMKAAAVAGQDHVVNDLKVTPKS